ncbi:organic hydroperoxide resistance protein [Acidipila sp. EB88]|uniref:organic hydroperoxide resistance protein n=1 Tax=Acidipila sp. EB88 TaxID=2305226 RepID=UPI000F5F8C8C|nr:organic hydroperoxide resistance protein [Acidipila sp. EB88]RRA50199.1 organic hydroperoxide resistance protein [Acidipila sp. EB88]
MAVLYTTRVRAEGGREGSVSSTDALLSLRLAAPRALGGREDATNPEQLFGAGYAACFESSLLHVAQEAGAYLQGTAVEAMVSIHARENGVYGLSVVLTVEVGGLSQNDAEQMVMQADAICPYSNAVRGNIDVQLHTIVR